jgi:ribosome maturation factor RimP
MDTGNHSIGRVWQLAAPLAANEGLEIVDIELKHEGGRSGRVLRVYLIRKAAWRKS